MERVQKEIEQDPYTAMFGRRREPFMETEAYRSWSDFCRAFLGLGGSHGKAADTTARTKEDGVPSAGFGPVRTATDARDHLDEAAASGLEFDPISGRMVQKPRVVDVDGPGASPKPLDREPAEADGQGAFGESKADSVKGLDAKTQRKPARKSTRKGSAKKHADVAHAIPETQAQASDTGTEPPGVIMAEPPKGQSDAAPQHMDSGEAGDQLPDSRNVHAPALDVGESPREPEQNAVSDPKPEWPSKEEKYLEFLSASDIRASYASRRLNTDPEIQKQEDRRALEDEVEAYVDPASKIDAQDIRERYDDSANRVDESCPATTESGAGVVESAHENTVPDTETASSQSLEADKTLHESTSPAMYRVLAYDSSTLQVTRAETSSSHAANEVLHPTDVLSRLNNAAKFLPHFADMHHDGYEIVSGGGDILVFKKVRSGEGSWAAPARSDYDTGYPPNDVTVVGGTCQSPETAKHESVYPGCPPNRPPCPPPTHDQPVSEADILLPKSESTFRRTARRMLLAGGATAATCYAMGVVIEYFRTGGPDGRGIDGFTEFESDRRRNR